MHIEIQVLTGLVLQIAPHVHMIHSIAHVLEDGIVRHDDVLPFEALLDLSVVGTAHKELDDAGEQVDLGQVEEGVVHVDALLAELDELVRVAFVDLLGTQEAQPVAGGQNVPESVNCENV